MFFKNLLQPWQTQEAPSSSFSLSHNSLSVSTASRPGITSTPTSSYVTSRGTPWTRKSISTGIWPASTAARWPSTMRCPGVPVCHPIIRPRQRSDTGEKRPSLSDGVCLDCTTKRSQNIPPNGVCLNCTTKRYQNMTPMFVLISL